MPAAQRTPPAPALREPRIQSLSRASRLLDIVSEEGEAGVGLASVARLSGLNKTTAYHLLDSLEALGFVERAPRSRNYRLGMRNFELGSRVRRQIGWTELARPTLERLRTETRETVNFALPLADAALIVDCLEGTHMLRAASYVGTRSAYHATALGKAIFAFAPEGQRRALYAAGPLARMSPRTIVDPERLERQLAKIRAGEGALDLEENEVGAYCIAYPVFDASGNVAASVSIAGLKQRMTGASMHRIEASLAREVQALSARLGHRNAVASHV